MYDMKYGGLIIEQKEFEFLKRLISLANYQKDATYKAAIYKLSTELKEAKIVSNGSLPLDVIRFNSLVTIETAYSVERTYQIVTPEKSDLSKNKISILTPMGLALFGYATGDRIKWTFPMGESYIHIKTVKQEASELMKVNYDNQYPGTPQ